MSECMCVCKREREEGEAIVVGTTQRGSERKKNEIGLFFEVSQSFFEHFTKIPWNHCNGTIKKDLKSNRRFIR